MNWNKNVVDTTQKICDGFVFKEFTKTFNQSEATAFHVMKGNFAKDENGNPITRTEEEMDNCEDV